jgi:hypothetical protein
MIQLEWREGRLLFLYRNEQARINDTSQLHYVVYSTRFSLITFSFLFCRDTMSIRSLTIEV